MADIHMDEGVNTGYMSGDMKIRKFTAENTHEAIAKVKYELGSEALIINTKKVRQKGLLGYFKKPLIEVMAAIDEQAQVKAKRLAGQARGAGGAFGAAGATSAGGAGGVVGAAGAAGVADAYRTPLAPNDVFAQFQSQLRSNGKISETSPYDLRLGGGSSATGVGEAGAGIGAAGAGTSAAGAGIGATAVAEREAAESFSSAAAAVAAAHTAGQERRPVVITNSGRYTAGPAALAAQAASALAYAQAADVERGAFAGAGAGDVADTDEGAGEGENSGAYSSENPGAHSGAQSGMQSDTHSGANVEVRIENIEAMLSKVYREVSISTKMVEMDDEKLAPLTKVLRLFYNNLVRNEVEPEFTMSIIEKVSDALQSEDNTYDAATVLYNEVASVLGKPETINIRRDEKPTVAIFVGPTGVGKTTTLAKIAADSALNRDLDVALITADTYRIAAVQQLKTYAEILGIPVSVAYTPGEIKQCIQDFADKDLILIDTAGRSHGRSSGHKTQFSELRELVGESSADEVFLVLSSTTSVKNSREIIRNYDFLDEYKLIFTKADETPVFGAMLNARMLTGKNLSYVTVGQSVPDDIEVASVDKIARNVIGSAAQ
ncbi:MAG: AAA family ATPase [Oscillospiraceae bacterium]|nr:AAA family ATPase [Oscillospiraceae bacterium]